MLDNLALDLTEVSLDDLKGNTNADEQTLTHLKNGGGTGQYANTPVTYADSSNPYDVPRIAVNGNCYDAYCINDPESGEWQSGSVTQATINGVTSVAQGKIGVYCNYCAANTVGSPRYNSRSYGFAIRCLFSGQ